MYALSSSLIALRFGISFIKIGTEVYKPIFQAGKISHLSCFVIVGT